MTNLISKPDNDTGYKEAGHKRTFRTMCPVKDRIQIKAAFEHKTELIEKKLPEKGKDGKVLLGPKNVKIGPADQPMMDYMLAENPA